MQSTSAMPQPEEAEAALSASSGKLSEHSNREQVLMWVIGTTFGVAMMILLVAMCLAEVSIQHNPSNATLSPATASPVTTIAASR